MLAQGGALQIHEKLFKFLSVGRAGLGLQIGCERLEGLRPAMLEEGFPGRLADFRIFVPGRLMNEQVVHLRIIEGLDGPYVIEHFDLGGAAVHTPEDFDKGTDFRYAITVPVVVREIREGIGVEHQGRIVRRLVAGTGSCWRQIPCWSFGSPASRGCWSILTTRSLAIARGYENHTGKN